MGGVVAGRPEDRSEDIIRELIERADRAERERQEIRDELREELKGIRGLLENALSEARTSGQRKTIASALYEQGRDDERSDLGIPSQVRRHRRGRGESDGGHLKLVIPAWVITAGAGAAVLARSTAGAAKAHPIALAGLRQAAHLGKRHWVTTTAAGVVGVGTLAGVTQVTLSPSVTSSRPPAVSAQVPDTDDGGAVPAAPGTHPSAAPPNRARLAGHPKASPPAPPPRIAAVPASPSARPTGTLLPSVQISIAVPVIASPSPSPPSAQGPGVRPPPTMVPTSGAVGGLAPSAGTDVRHILRGAVHAVDGLTGGSGR